MYLHAPGTHRSRMPPVYVKSIVSFSSEDPNYPASNLLKPGHKKWKCREPGERQAFVVLKLEEPVQIGGIDIGNEHSALIEVLVARSGPSNPSFTEILLATKFMNPVDSRNSTGTNGVQCFGAAALVPSVASEKWDLVKIICTQPFNARVKYGLTFVAFHPHVSVEKKEKCLVPEKFQQQIKAEVEKAKASVELNLGRFKLREESPESDDTTEFSNLFARWKNKNLTGTTSTGPSVSALMRDSSTPAALQRNIPTPGSVRNVAKHRPFRQTFDDSDDEAQKSVTSTTAKKNRNDESVLYDAEDEKPTKKYNGSIALAQNDTSVVKKENSVPKPLQDTSRSSKLHDVSSSKFKAFLDLTGQSVDRMSHRNDERQNSTITSETKNPREESKKTSDKPYNKARPQLAIDKQAVPSKRNSSLIKSPAKDEKFATPKKPKLDVVDADSEPEVKRTIKFKPFGKLLENVVLVISGIQNPDRANIRNQALAMGAKYKPDWDSSCTHLICAYKNTPKYNQVHGKGKIVKQAWIEKCYTNRKRLSWRKFALDTAEANASDSEEEIVDIAKKPEEKQERATIPDVETLNDAVMLHELSDSEDEPRGTSKVYEISTEEEGNNRNEIDSESMQCSVDIFKNKMFYLHPELGAVDIIKLEKYIKTFKGTISKEIGAVDYVIARSKQTLPAGSRAELVKPLWVYECNDMECLIPVNRYRID
uniref:BRCT domain-containing protein n=1 Tax=Anopheles farauti TaxID=69004 RepID=A0A182QDD4_9DIPT